MAPRPPDPDHLKLVALDEDDLAVLSAHLQDAIVRTGDIAYLPDLRRFALIARRFDWEWAAREPRRRLTAVHFDRVMGCRTRGIDRTRADAPLELLAITFQATQAPEGVAQLVFAGGGSVELRLECVEACLKDLGPVWAAGQRPTHDLENT